jgi:hypothetical protein
MRGGVSGRRRQRSSAAASAVEGALLLPVLHDVLRRVRRAGGEISIWPQWGMEGEQVASEIQEKVGGRSGEWAQGVAGGEEEGEGWQREADRGTAASLRGRRGGVVRWDLVGTGEEGEISKSPTPLSNSAPLGVRHYVA